MKTFLKLLTAFALLFSVAISLNAQDALKRVLEKGDVEKFIKTLPLMYDDMVKYGITYELEEGEADAPAAARNNKALQLILKKHGWDNRFHDKARVIALSYAFLVSNKEIKKASAEVDDAIAQVKANKRLSEAQKKKLIADLEKTRGTLRKTPQDIKATVHPDDIALVKPHVKELTKLFESLGDDDDKDAVDDDSDMDDDDAKDAADDFMDSLDD